MSKKSLFLLIAGLLLITACSSNANKVEELVSISTDQGEMIILLYDETPLHKENFLKLAKEGYYDGTTFHRIIDGFMIQGGDPLSKDSLDFNDGTGGPGYRIKAEFHPDLFHKRGAIAAARTGGPGNPDMESSGSQFYIVDGSPVSGADLINIEEAINATKEQQVMGDFVQLPENDHYLEALRRNYENGNEDSLNILTEQVRALALTDYVAYSYTEEQINSYEEVGGAPFLDQNYTVFGEVLSGLSVIDSIAVQEKDARDRPLANIPMEVKVIEMTRGEITKQYGFIWKENE